MDEFAHPRVVVGVDASIHGLAALRAAVAEARRRRVPLHAIRCHNSVQTENGAAVIDAAFHEALGAIPDDIEIHAETVSAPLTASLVSWACDPRDLIVVGNSGKGALRALWSGSVPASLVRGARCPILAVPAPEMAHAAHERGHARAGRGDLWEQFELSAPDAGGPLRRAGRTGW
jgi:nucleotide-binding universal stress UspA family protein